MPLLLDFLRSRGASNELSPNQAVDKLLTYFREPGALRLPAGNRKPSEPPASGRMLGAIGEQIDQPESRLATLRRSLNPLSRFDFGVLSGKLACCARWQAKEPQGR